MLKISLAAALSVIITGATAWIAFGGSAIDRAEMVDYVHGQIALEDMRVKNNSDSIRALTQSVNALVKSQQELIVAQSLLIQRVDQLITTK